MVKIVKIYHRFKLRLILTVISIIVFILVVFHPDRHAKHYTYVPLRDIIPQLVQINTNTNNSKQQKVCSYDEIIRSNRDTYFKDTINYNYIKPNKGGEYIPTNCISRFKVAIIIPYRKREQQLHTFITYIHNFLQAQNIHYRIYVADQQDNEPFNRAKMFNIGSHEAIKSGFPCLIFHDVDLIPLTTGNIYACSLRPRHMSSSLDTFRFNLPYEGLFGGVISIQTEQFIKVNGMSNMYEGWGGEDDDFFDRLHAHDIHPYRFPAEISKYTMLRHKKAKPSENRYKLLTTALDRQTTDGLSELLNLSSNFTTYNKVLYTHIIVN